MSEFETARRLIIGAQQRGEIGAILARALLRAVGAEEWRRPHIAALSSAPKPDGWEIVNRGKAPLDPIETAMIILALLTGAASLVTLAFIWNW